MNSAVLLAFLSMPACSKDEKKVEEVVKPDAGAAIPDAAAPQEVPLSPYDLLKSLPKPPPAFKAEPGTTLESLKTNKQIKPSPYSPRWLVANAPSPAFPMIIYQLNREMTHVETIVATLHPGYGVKERKDALREVATRKLRKGKALVHATKVGTQWALIDYAIQLRTDKTDQSLELTFSRRGRFDPTAPSPP